MAGTKPLAAYCEDANSDDSDTQTDTRKHHYHHNSTGHANVAAKRSHPSDLNNNKPVDVAAPPDAASDSGYSSRSAATMASADSAQSNTSSPPTSAGSGPAPSPHRRRPTLEQTRERSSQNNPRKPLVRTESLARRIDKEECTVPNCECKQSQRRRRPQPSPLDSALEINYPPFDQRSQRSDPSVTSNRQPPSPQSARQPQPYAQGSAIIQPASSTRRRTSSTSRPRPVSYHSGVTSEAGRYWVPGMPYPTQPGDRGPPPSMSAHYAIPTPMQPFPTMGQTPPNNYYPPGHPMYSPPYDTSRPPLAHRNSSQYSTRRPISQYGAPVISYDAQPYSSTSKVAARPSARYDTQQAATFSSSSSEESESEEETDRDRRRMPPPRQLPQRRPSHRQRTSDLYDDRMTQSQTLPPRDRESHPSRPTSTAPSRASSLRRPSLASRDAPKSVSYSNSIDNAKVVVETAKSRRRQSYMGPSVSYETESKRNHPLYRGNTVINSSQPRRKTDADTRRRDENTVAANTREAEAYQQRIRGDSGVPFTEQLLKAQKRSSRVPSGGSEAGSSRSRNSHDRTSRVSASGHSIVSTNQANGEVRLRLDGSTNINLEVSGGEQRTIRIGEAEDGTTQLIIANTRGNEVAYKSERGSIAGRRPLIMSPRDAEEDSIMGRSRRSSRSGRAEAERRPLRRKYED